MNRRVMLFRLQMTACAVATLSSMGAGACRAAVVFDLDLDSSGVDGVLDDGSRWNAAPMTLFRNGSNWERSLVGGLRYSVQGGSYAGYRDQFTWRTTPTADDFADAIARAFAAWTVDDPVTGLGTPLTFVEDFATPVDTTLVNFVRLGAEIDLLADDIGSGQRGTSYFNSVSRANGVTLTSGTTGYGGYAIAGADVTMNTNVVWSSLSDFEVILTHEIGHALGLGDVEDYSGNGFIDNNYDPADPLGTLTDSWALLVNPLDPSASPGLSSYAVPNNSLGIDHPGVDILMESSIPQSLFDQGAALLANDDFGGRQFLYPVLANLPGDYDGDRFVDAADFDVWRNAYGSISDLAADGNQDGRVDAADYTVWRDNLMSPALDAPAVPEPASALLGIATLLLGSTRRRLTRR